ncbi:hypothetical protein MRB53_013746 [Persea americana]|uniref:Uncharacterized protein n=1 Tax=Persea americana TaxID=3435 RepID=A0ACC2K8U3_PERAE|nr:hypothetical protein MRB53_013746 [Persea americana]
MDPGTFFSGLVRQIMPFISQTTPADATNASSVRAVTAHHNTESDPPTSQTDGETSTEVGNSRRRGDHPSSPSSKHQKAPQQIHDLDGDVVVDAGGIEFELYGDDVEMNSLVLGDLAK